MNDESVVHTFRRVFAEHSARTALVDRIKERTFSYAHLEDLSSRFAAKLGAVGSDDRVLILLPNGAEMVVTYLACMQRGITSVPVNPSFSAAEVQLLVNNAAPAVIVTDAANAPKIPAELAARVLRAESDVDLAALASAPRFAEAAFPGAQDEKLAHVVFSSGSTGIPKAIPLRFGRIVGHAAMFARSHGIGVEHAFYNVLPLAYLGGWYNLTLVPFMAGATVVLDKEFGGAGIYRFWTTVLDHGVNALWVTPSILAALIGAGAEDDAQLAAIKARIRWAMVGMAPLPPALKAKFEATFGFRTQQSYGLSETFLFTSWKSDTSLEDTCVGKVLDGYDVRLSDAGEILVRGKWMMDGYWNQPELTAKVLDPEGWFHTGDIGRFDESGGLFITGRIKDLIIRGGVNVSPGEIEDVLTRAEGVREAAVVGANDDLYGERVVAFVTLHASASADQPRPTPAELVKFSRKHLSAGKVPSNVHVIDTMPLNASGKVDKPALRKLIADGRYT